jgi:ABC-type nitrate/sulfonate/bicarbonate transport system permease component
MMTETASRKSGISVGRADQGTSRRAVRPRGERVDSRSQRYILGGVAVVGAFAIWELLTLLNVAPRIILPSPLDVVNAFGDMFASGTFGEDLAASGEEFIYGFLLAALVGIVVGVLVGWYRTVGYLLDPFITFMYAVPRVALSPLLLVWLGIGLTSKVALVFLVAVFPVLINTSNGIRNLDQQMLRTARCFNATDLQIFRTIALPGSVPFILGGLRLAIGQALIGVFVAELLGSQYGIGTLVTNAGNQFQTATVFAGLIIFALAGVLLTAVLQRAEKRFDAWKI